jgi:hypothetical protein
VPRHHRILPLSLLLVSFATIAQPCGAAETSARTAVRFNTAFEGAALGQIEVLGETAFRVHVPGQQDERGRNRQATWFYFRMDNVRGRDLTLTLTGFTPGEYNDKPSLHMRGEPKPVFSYDNEHWQQFTEMSWDKEQQEGTLRFRPEADSVWLAFVPPYTHTRLVQLLKTVAASPHARVEIVGHSVLGRALPVVTVSDFSKPDATKKTIWLQARDHAWESPTSFIVEGALTFALSDEPAARDLRERYILVFTPMVDPDGSALGRVRFNANGWDFNRHWDEVDLRDPFWLQQTPEIWYYKKAIRDYAASGHTIALLVHLHNTASEYMTADAPTPAAMEHLKRFAEILEKKTQFDPTRPARFIAGYERRDSAPERWWMTYGVPLVLIEANVAPVKKLGGYPTVEQRTQFGRELLLAMAEAVE